MFLQILNNLTDIFYVGSAICFWWMAPKIWDLFKRDLAKVLGNEQKFNELSKITQKNADEMISRINLVRHSPKSIFNKINNIHHKSFPNKICQLGAMGSNILKQGQGRQSSKGRQSSQGPNKSGSKKSSDDSGGDGEPPRPLLTQAALAELLRITKKTLQNQYSATPWLLPPAIQISGARGPRWTPQSVQQWLDERPKHTPKTAPPAQIRKVGRPRIAYAGNGGAQ